MAVFKSTVFKSTVFKTGGAGAQTLTLPGFSIADSFGGLTVSPGAVSLTLPGFSIADIFGGLTVSPGAVALSLPGFSIADSFGGLTVAPGAVSLALPGFSVADSFGGIVVTQGLALVLPGFSVADSFGALTVTPGAVTIALPGFSGADSFGSVVVTHAGALALTLPGFSVADIFGALTIALAGGLPPVIGDATPPFGITPGAAGGFTGAALPFALFPARANAFTGTLGPFGLTLADTPEPATGSAAPHSIFGSPIVYGGDLETITPDGTGAIARPADVFIRRFLDVDVYAFGADPDAPSATNDTAIANAVARANAIGAVLRAHMRPGTYDFGAAIPALTTAAGIDMEASIFRDAAGLTVPFLTIGYLVSGGNVAKVVRGIRLQRVTQSDWSNEGCIGLLLICLRYTAMHLDETRGFTIGARLEGKSDGTTSADATHNDIRLGLIYNNKIGLDLYSNASIAAGAPNQNRFYGGDFTCDTGLNTSTDRYGVAFRRAANGYTNHNGNVFYAPSFQHARAGSGIAYCVLHETNGSQNVIHDARGEIGSGTMRAYLNNGGGGDNSIEFNYSTGWNLLPGVEGASATRFAWAALFKRYSTYASRALRPLLVVPNLRATMFQDVYSGNVSYGLDDLHIAFVSDPGASATPADCCLRNSQASGSGSAILPDNEGVSILSGRGIGCLLDTQEIKTFCVLYQLANDDSDGKLQFRCFNDSGALLDDSNGPMIMVDHPSVTVTYSATTRGWVMSNEASVSANSTRLGWKVADAVKTVEIALVWGGTNIVAQSFGVFTAEPIAARCWHGVTGGTSRLSGSKSHNFASIADAAAAGTSLTINGAQFGDLVVPSVGVSIGIASLTGYIQAADTVGVTLFNKNGVNLDLADTTLHFDVFKRRVPYT